MGELVASWQDCLRERWVHPLVALAAFNLDFLCIHPFRDGNGRVSRLLLLLQCYHLGFEVGRFISLERLIEDNKDRYYETLEISSQGWHEGRHDPWPYVHYLLFILKTAFREFEQRVGQMASPRGAKTELVRAAIDRSTGNFRVADLLAVCPGVSVDLVRRVLKDLRTAGEVECLGRGQAAAWRRTRIG
jgi:Fic family protein